MKLELRYPATPENALDFAQLAVEVAWEEFGVDLDYSPGSLEAVDAQIDSLREDGLTGEAAAEALFVLGCYVGEVMARGLGGRRASGPRPRARRAAGGGATAALHARGRRLLPRRAARLRRLGRHARLSRPPRGRVSTSERAHTAAPATKKISTRASAPVAVERP